MTAHSKPFAFRDRCTQPFSSKGPTQDERTKPEITAPGGGVLSSISSLLMNPALNMRLSTICWRFLEPKYFRFFFHKTSKHHNINLLQLRNLLFEPADTGDIFSLVDLLGQLFQVAAVAGITPAIARRSRILSRRRLCLREPRTLSMRSTT